jgi:hypothetical protein
MIEIVLIQRVSLESTNTRRQWTSDIQPAHLTTILAFTNKMPRLEFLEVRYMESMLVVLPAEYLRPATQQFLAGVTPGSGLAICSTSA